MLHTSLNELWLVVAVDHLSELGDCTRSRAESALIAQLPGMLHRQSLCRISVIDRKSQKTFNTLCKSLLLTIFAIDFISAPPAELSVPHTIFAFLSTLYCGLYSL